MLPEKMALINPWTVSFAPQNFPGDRLKCTAVYERFEMISLAVFSWNQPQSQRPHVPEKKAEQHQIAAPLFSQAILTLRMDAKPGT